MKYLLLLLPFMWGCAEKKEAVKGIVPASIYFKPGMYTGKDMKNIMDGTAVYDTIVNSYSGDTTFQYNNSDSTGGLLRAGISIDGRSYEESTISEWELQSLVDSLPGGHSIHVEPYDSIRLLRYDTIYLPTSVRMYPVWDAIKNIQNPK